MAFEEVLDHSRRLSQKFVLAFGQVHDAGSESFSDEELALFVRTNLRREAIADCKGI